MLAGQSQILSLRSFMTYYGLKYFVVTFRIHIEEINHTVLLHMTEKMSYKHSEVLSAVLTNKACHTLTVYFLLNKKMKRISKEYRVSWRKQWRQHVLHRTFQFFLLSLTLSGSHRKYSATWSRKRASCSRLNGGSTLRGLRFHPSRRPRISLWTKVPSRRRNTEMVRAWN